jgi:molybdopterin-binding protein
MSGDYNAPFVRHFFPDRSMVLLTLAHREQGLIVSPGNPHKVKSLEDLVRPGLRFINRNRGSGTRLWLDEHLVRAGIDSRLVAGYEDEVSTHTAVAAAVHQDSHRWAWVSVPQPRHELGFVPFPERYDLVLHRSSSSRRFSPPFLIPFSAEISATGSKTWVATMYLISEIKSYSRRFVMKISARNILKGKIVKIVHGAVNSEVTIELPGGSRLVSIITNGSVDTLGLTEGKEAYAIIKASNVMVGVD